MSLLNQNVPIPIEAIEIDKEIYNLEILLNTNLTWLQNAYGRAYRKIELVDKKIVYYPEVYRGVVNNSPEYIRTTYDSSKTGMCYFVVGKEQPLNFENRNQNYFVYPVSIIFMVNLKLINNPLLQTEIFTQNLIREVRQLLTNAFTKSTRYTITSVEREFNEIFKEYTLDEFKNTLTAPHDAFRLNMNLTLQEDCGVVIYDKCQAIKNNINENEIQNCIIPFIDFSNDANFNALTQIQKDELILRLC